MGFLKVANFLWPFPMSQRLGQCCSGRWWGDPPWQSWHPAACWSRREVNLPPSPSFLPHCRGGQKGEFVFLSQVTGRTLQGHRLKSLRFCLSVCTLALQLGSCGWLLSPSAGRGTIPGKCGKMLCTAQARWSTWHSFTKRVLLCLHSSIALRWGIALKLLATRPGAAMQTFSSSQPCSTWACSSMRC